MQSDSPPTWKTALLPGVSGGVLLALMQFYLILQTIPNNLELLLILGSFLYFALPTLMAFLLTSWTQQARQGYRSGVITGVCSSFLILLLFTILLFANAPIASAPSLPPAHSGAFRGMNVYALLEFAVYSVYGVNSGGVILSLIGAFWGSRLSFS